LKYQLLASDIDGTLIRRDQSLSPAVREAIDKLKRAGKRFTLASGRPVGGLSKYVGLVSPDTPVISHNGATILCPDSGRLVYQRLMEPDSVLRLVELGREAGALVIVWSLDEMYSSEVSGQIEEYSRRNGEPLHLLQDPVPLAKRGVNKVLWLDEPVKIAADGAALTREPVEAVCFCTSTPHILEFMHESVSKGEGLRKVCEYCGVDVSESIAAGDQLNDLAMLQAAGLGVAMGNAHEDVKRLAGFVTASNEEDGLARVIERVML
jgi:Cof subfamily protein (haloacid dehalogenase superfamily)